MFLSHFDVSLLRPTTEQTYGKMESVCFYPDSTLLDINGKHSLRYSVGPKLWNMLPEKLTKLPSVQTFKKQIRNIELTSLLADGCRNCVLCSN